MSDASVRTIGHDDEASLWTTTSHSTIGIDHLKQKGPQWYDIDKRRCGEFGPLMTSSPHNPFMTNGRQRPPTSEKSTATVYPSGPLSDAVVFDSLMTPALRPRDPAMAGVGRCSKAVIAAPPDLGTTRKLVETRIIPMNHPSRTSRQFSLVDFKSIAQGVDLPEKPVRHQVRGAEWTFHRDWGRSDHWERPLTPGSRPTTPVAPGSRPTTPAAPGSRRTTPGSRPATPGNRIIRDIP